MLSNIQTRTKLTDHLAISKNGENEECSKLYYEYNFTSITENSKLWTYVSSNRVQKWKTIYFTGIATKRRKLVCAFRISFMT